MAGCSNGIGTTNQDTAAEGHPAHPPPLPPAQAGAGTGGSFLVP
jgi:hypothetical protein